MKQLSYEEIIKNDNRDFVRAQRHVVTYALLWTAVIGFALGYLTGVLTSK